MLILNKVKLPGDDEYFIIMDPFNQKHLLKTENYERYELNPGKTVLCRVDKINCKGKIFFEPKHPYYQEGETYIFRKKGGELFDILENKCVLVNNTMNNTDQYKILKIKKGICYIITI